MTREHGTIEGLQVLRAVAALLVVVHHAFGNSYAVGHFGVHLFEVGRIGVDLFFVLSGFIIAFSTEEERSCAVFVRKRLVRVLPLYWSLTLFIFLAAQFVPFLIGEGENTAGPLVRSLLFVPYLNADGTMSPVVGLGWTLNFEMMFYALFAVGLLAMPGRRIGFAVAVLCAMALLGGLFAFQSAPLAFFTRNIVVEFAFGLLLYALFRDRPVWFARLQHTAPLTLLWLAAGAVLPLELPRFLSLGVPAALLLAPFVSLRVAGLPFGRFLVHLGDASYALYLTHLYIVGTTYFVIRTVLPATTLAVLAVAAFVILASVVAALLVHGLFERPVLAALRRLRLPGGVVRLSNPVRAQR